MNPILPNITVPQRMHDTAADSPLGVLADLTSEIAKEHPLAVKVDRILCAAMRLTKADFGVVGLLNADADQMRTLAHQPATMQVDPVSARGQGIGGYILETGQRYRGRYDALPSPMLAAIREHDVIGFPISWDGELLGYIATTTARKFTETHVELVEVLANIAANALEHARRVDFQKRSSQRFELIARIAAEIHRERDRDAILQRAADAIHQTLRFSTVDIPAVDATDAGILVLRARGGETQNASRDDRLSIDNGIMGAAARELRTQLVNDARRDARYICPPGKAPAQAELAVPIKTSNRVHGVLNVESDRPFDDLDRRTMEVIADYLAVAIDNAALFEQAGHAAVMAERQRLARELHDNVTQILSSMSLLSQTLTTAWERSPEEGARRAARLQQLAQTAFAEMRMLLHQLAPSQLGSITQVSRRSRVLVGVENLREHALPSALTKLLASAIPETIVVKSSFAGYVPQKLELEEALYRVCQEAISNTVRHAGAQRIRVEAAVTATHAVLRVADDGRGLDTVFRPGVGLGSMRTRIESLGGQFRISQNTPNGTLVEARVPRSDREVVE
ncbi:MAG TPA: GAF domain-containing protein [Rudaea sp.]|jgi:signal transduction histidine kinase|nr:GAF domain-containing protein [Rudaea sp.]